MTLTEVPDGDGVVTLFTWWGVVPLSPEVAAAILVVGWSLAGLWMHGIVLRVSGLKPWYRRRPMTRHGRARNRVTWVPEVER